MTNAPKVETLLHAFTHWEAKTPDTVYLTQPYPDGRVEDITWREAGNQARRMASYLQSLDLPKRSNIAIVGKNSAHWIMADLAIWMAGHVTVPLYPTVNAATAQHVLEHSEAQLLFVGKLDGINDTWNDLKKGIPSDLRCVSLPMSPLADAPQWQDLIGQNEPLTDIEMPDQGDLATIVYTSGSTGKPKGVMHSFGSMIAVARGIEEQFTLTPDDRMLSYLPLAHVAERAAVESTSLYYGFRVYFAQTLDTFQQDLKRARPTLFFSVPRLWTKFYQAICKKIPPQRQRILFAIPVLSGVVKRKILSELGLDHVRFALTGSAPLPPNLIKWYRDLGLELLDVYGMSENFGYSHATRPGDARIGYVGKPTPGSEHRIADNGEIQVKSPGHMLGYYKMPDKTKEDMTDDGFLKTGDMGEIDSQDRLRITGRVKELFKTSKGKYVAPVPIENRLCAHDAVEVACVTGVEQPQPFALLMLSEETQEALKNGKLDRNSLSDDFKQLLQEANTECEEHEKLDYAVVVKDAWTMENDFLTPTMKIKRNTIEERYLPHADTWLAKKQTVIWE